MTYRETTDGDVEGEVLETGPRGEFDLEAEGERIEKRLRFLATVAGLWNLATRVERGPEPGAEPFPGWLARARKNYHELLALLDAVHEHPVPEPTGSYDSVVEYERRRGLKDRLLLVTVATGLDTAV